jgi:hypothetical protein
VTETRRDVVKSQHEFDAWPGAEAKPLQRPFLPALDRIPDYQHEARSAIPGLRGAFTDHFAQQSGDGLVSVRVIQYESAGEAHEGLVDVLEDSMAPQLPSCADRGLDLREPCFCGTGDPIEFLIFARANLVVRVESIGQEPVDVTEVATELDRQLQEAGAGGAEVAS